MATWDTILSHYFFISKNYSELSDPADLSKTFVDGEPEYPILVIRPNSTPGLQPCPFDYPYYY